MLAYADIQYEGFIFKNVIIFKRNSKSIKICVYQDKQYTVGEAPDYHTEWWTDKFSLGIDFPNVRIPKYSIN